MFFLIEEYAHYKQIAIIFTLISIIIYPIFYRFSNQMGISCNWGSKQEVFTNFIKKNFELKNTDSFQIYEMGFYDEINDMKLSKDPYIFENFGVDSVKYYEIKNEMKFLNVSKIEKFKNAMFFSVKNYAAIVYYQNPEARYNEIRYGEYNLKLSNNWYAKTQ